MHALDGITVLEFANYVSGPYAGMMLSDLGAEVIKIESPDGGDPFRGWGAADYSATFGSVNRNKKSVVLDLKSPMALRRRARWRRLPTC
jgi:formyl-CoA transferase